MNTFNILYMKEAIEQAKKAAALGEIPIGAVIVHNDSVIASGYNMRETMKCATKHAEIIAIENAAKKLGGWRLPNCDIYVTLEPCPMCSGAIIQARFDNLYFGAYDAKTGCCGSKMNLFENDMFYHNVNVVGGIMEEECSELIKLFFKKLRKTKKEMR